MTTLLITGGAGFIGSNFIPFFLEHYPKYRIINLDLLTYAGNLQNLEACEENERYIFVQGNINDRTLVQKLFTSYDVQSVIHFAAESHVDNSIANPDVFIQTNVNGTFTLLDVARQHWMRSPFEYHDEYKSLNDPIIGRFHHISTDEVYGSLNATDRFTETTPYAPNSPYSASKASSDMLVRSYHKTFGLNTIITNCSNNYGPKQHKEKLIPTIIHHALHRKPIPIYGDGKNIRDWLYVLDHCRGIECAFHQGKAGEVYNIGGNNECTNIEIVHTICDRLDQRFPFETSYRSLITFVQDRAGHDRRYAIDASKIEQELGWRPREDFKSGIEKTLDWYIQQIHA